jgi:hypothetical protein
MKFGGGVFNSSLFNGADGGPVPPAVVAGALTGSIHAGPRMSGNIAVDAQLSGEVFVGPRLTGRINVYPEQS